MGTPTANVSRRTFDANKSYRRMLLQQGVPVTDADINELQDNLEWWQSRAMDTLLGFDTTQVTVDAAMYEFVHPVDPSKTWPADAPAVAATPESWFPGSMRPWVHTAGLSNDFYVMWGPCWVQGLFVEDTDQRGPAGLYSDLGHIITHGVVSALPGGTTFEDDSKDFNAAGGDLHLVGPAAGVGNGTARPCRVRFVTGAEAGNTYPVSAVPTSARLTVTGPYLAGGPGIGDEYIVLPNTITFVNGQVENVWLCIWVEDQDMEEDADLEEPMMLLEPSHRLRVRYWHRILRDGATMPTSADRPDYPDVAPQTHEEKVYWVKVATITPGVGAPTILPENIVYATPGHYELAPIGPLVQALKGLLDLGTGEWKDIKIADDTGPGASLAANQHAILRTGTEGIRFPALAAEALSRFIDLDFWDGAAAVPLFDVMGWKNTAFDGGWGSAIMANALLSHSKSSGDDALLYLGATTQELTNSLSGFLISSQTEAKAWLRLFADDAGATADFLATLSLNANFSQDGTTVGVLSLSLSPDDGDNQDHYLTAALDRTAGVDTPMSYALRLSSPSSVTDGFAGLRIDGITGAGQHTTQGETVLHVLSGDVKFGLLGSPVFWFDDSANLLQFLGGPSGKVDMRAGSSMQLLLDSSGDIALLGRDANTYFKADDGAGEATIFATDIILAGPVTAQEDITLGNNKRYAFSGGRKRRRKYYMNDWNRAQDATSGDNAFYDFLPGGVAPVNPAKYNDTQAAPGTSDAWPAAFFEGTASTPVVGFFRVTVLPGETLEQIVFGISTAAANNWDVEIYSLDSSGTMTLQSTNTGVFAPLGTGIRPVTVTLTTPYTPAGEPADVLIKLEHNVGNDVNLFWIQTVTEVDNLEEAIGLFDT